MDSVAHTLHFGKVRESFEIQSNLRIREWRPANYATDQIIAGGNLSEPYCFLYSSSGLDDNRPCNAGQGCHCFQVCQEEIPPKNLHTIRHPRILGRHIAPEVMVCVDAFVDHSLVILSSVIRSRDSSEELGVSWTEPSSIYRSSCFQALSWTSVHLQIARRARLLWCLVDTTPDLRRLYKVVAQVGNVLQENRFVS